MYLVCFVKLIFLQFLLWHVNSYLLINKIKMFIFNYNFPASRFLKSSDKRWGKCYFLWAMAQTGTTHRLSPKHSPKVIWFAHTNSLHKHTQYTHTHTQRKNHRRADTKMLQLRLIPFLFVDGLSLRNNWAVIVHTLCYIVYIFHKNIDSYQSNLLHR